MEKNATGHAIDDCGPGSAPVFIEKHAPMIRTSQRPPFFGARFFRGEGIYNMPRGDSGGAMYCIIAVAI